MKKVIPILLVIAGIGFFAGGIYATVRGFDAKAQVRDELLAQNITTTEDAVIPNAVVQDAATADAMADIIGVHALEATGGETYAGLGRFVAADGGDAAPAFTNDEALAQKDEVGNPVPNPLRNVAFQASSLQTSLHVSHMAFNVADLVIGLGAFIAVMGIVVAAIGLSLRSTAAAAVPVYGRSRVGDYEPAVSVGV